MIVNTAFGEAVASETFAGKKKYKSEAC